MKKLALAVSIMAAAVSCRKPAQSVSKAGDIELELLFEHDGCRMYRFIDGGRAVYWSDCRGRTEYTRDLGDYKTGHSYETEQAITDQ